MTRLPYKPHIYLCVYPSGLKFWRVRKPLNWNAQTRDYMTKAYSFVARLNGELS